MRLLYCAAAGFFLSVAIGCAVLAPSRSVAETVAPIHEAASAEPQERLSGSPYVKMDRIQIGTIAHLPTGVEISKDRLIDLLAAARVIYVGEVHDNLEEHRVQLEILKALWERNPGGVAVGMEMFRRQAQPQLNQWVGGQLDEKSFLRMWYDNWRMDIAYYREILEFIRANRIPLIGLNTPHKLEMRVGMKGIEGLSSEERNTLPEIDRDDPYHRLAVEAIFKGHSPSGRGNSGFESFYDTMLLWDETMAESIARYLTSPEGRDKKMVVFAGGFHVNYGFGIPRRAFRRFQVPFQIVIPYSLEIPAEKRFQTEITSPDIPLPLSDFIWRVGYAEPAKKRVSLGIQIETFQSGIRVIGVSPDSPAAEAGIKEGDIVISLDGEILREPFDLTYAVRQKSPGDRVKLKIVRGGQTIEIEAVMRPSRHP